MQKDFKKYGWPVIDVTRKSVEETAASVIKIHDFTIKNVEEIILASKSKVRKNILKQQH